MQVELRLLPSGRRLRVATGTTLHRAVVEAGLPLASACGADGICGRCAVTVLRGAGSLSPETEQESRVKRRNRVPAGQRLACRALVRGDVEIRASYWG